MGNAQKKLGFTSSHRRRSRKESGKGSPTGSVCCSRSRSSVDDTHETLEDLLTKGPIENFYDVNPKIVLGRGHYAVVNLGVCKRTGIQVAVKRIQINKSRIEALQREVQVLRKIGSHPNIVTLHDIFVAENELQLVLELLKGGELFDRMVEKGPYSEQEASHHIRKIGLALKYLHRHGIVHRDLKPENLILSDKRDDSELKIADFGLSKIVDDVNNSTMATVCGTWAYCAPEVKTSVARRIGGSSQACYTAAVDLWSVGVIMFVILAAYHPFDPDGDASDSVLWDNICRGEFDFNDPAWDNISNQAKDLIKKLIVVDPAKRYDVDQLLGHPWVTQTASVPSTPITPLINKQLKGFVKHQRGMTPKAVPNRATQFPAVQPMMPTVQNIPNMQNVPVQNIPYYTRSQAQNTNNQFMMKNAQNPPQSIYTNQGRTYQVPEVNMIPAGGPVQTQYSNLTLNTLVNSKQSDVMEMSG